MRQRGKLKKLWALLEETDIKFAVRWLFKLVKREFVIALKTSHPARLLFIGYILISLVGAGLLMLPFTRTNGDLSFLDALFTSVSALCVTGLIVKDTAGFFTFWGQLIILTLIFVGGLGYMTLGYFFLSQLRSKLTVKKLVLETFPGVQVGNLGHFVIRIIKVALFLQVSGAILLFIDFLFRGIPPIKALWHASFNSVSAYCNAGFSTFATSLMQFRGDFLVNGVISALIVIGGIGFVVIEETISYWENRHALPHRKLSLHTRVSLMATVLLLSAGALMIYFLENSHLFADYTLSEKILASIFQSVTPRTAGFNTVPIDRLTPGSHLLLLVLMFIGGSPTGTAGGVKTTTTAALFFWLIAYSKGRKTVSYSGYRLPDETLKRAIAIFFWGSAYIVLASMALFVAERANASDFIPYLFEVVSAFGTVGLSFGSQHFQNVSLAADFTDAGKFIIIVTMLVGKVGILAALSSIVRREREYFRYPEGKYIVG